MFVDEYSGATCHPATNRTIATTATANPGDPPTICQHGNDSSFATFGTRWIQCPSPDAESGPTTCFPIPQPDAAAADECSYGRANTTFITSP